MCKAVKLVRIINENRCRFISYSSLNYPNYVLVRSEFSRHTQKQRITNSFAGSSSLSFIVKFLIKSEGRGSALHTRNLISSARPSAFSK